MILYTRNDLEISVNGRKERVLDGLRISGCHSESPMNEFSVLLYFVYFKAMYKLASHFTFLEWRMNEPPHSAE